MQLTLPPTARGFLVPWELNAYSLAVLQQQVSDYLLGKKSTFCGLHCVPRTPCTEVYIYATTWKDDWKKDLQEMCYKATATGCMPGTGLGGYGAAGAGGCGAQAQMMGMGMGMGGAAAHAQAQAAMLGGMGGMMAGGMGGGMGGMMMGGMGGAGAGYGCGGGFGMGPACPPMMHGAPINWGHRPLPILSDTIPPVAAAAAAAAAAVPAGTRPLPKI